MFFNMFFDSNRLELISERVTWGMGKKKGATLCSNLVNLKSNTMKNTVQRYGFSVNLQIFWVENYVV